MRRLFVLQALVLRVMAASTFFSYICNAYRWVPGQLNKDEKATKLLLFYVNCLTLMAVPTLVAAILA
jgi:hypothetical protein